MTVTVTGQQVQLINKSNDLQIVTLASEAMRNLKAGVWRIYQKDTRTNNLECGDISICMSKRMSYPRKTIWILGTKTWENIRKDKLCKLR